MDGWRKTENRIVKSQSRVISECYVQASRPGYGTACSCPSSLGDLWYCSVSSFQEELRCRPGVEGGYVAQAYHLYAPLLEGPCPSVPRHLPPGLCGGGTGLGLTLACSPGHSTPFLLCPAVTNNRSQRGRCATVRSR